MERFEITEEVRKVLLEAAEHYEGLAACLRSLCSEKKKDGDDGQLMLPLSDEKEEKPVITLEQVRERQEAGWANTPVESPTRTVGEIVRANVCTFFNFIFMICI